MCRKCHGLVLLDRSPTEHHDYEMYCLKCGERGFVPKKSSLGKQLTKLEYNRERERPGVL